MTNKLSLHKSKRLKRKKYIEALFANPKVLYVFPFRILYTLNEKQNNDECNFLFSCGVSKKLFKQAIKRNRIKRLIRESFRLQQNQLQLIGTKQLHIFFQYTHKEILDFKEMYNAVSKSIDTFNNEKR